MLLFTGSTRSIIPRASTRHFFSSPAASAVAIPTFPSPPPRHSRRHHRHPAPPLRVGVVLSPAPRVGSFRVQRPKGVVAEIVADSVVIYLDYLIVVFDQGDSLNLPDHRIHKDGDGDASFQLKSDSLPHAHAQTTKTFHKHQDSKIMKAQELSNGKLVYTPSRRRFVEYSANVRRTVANFSHALPNEYSPSPNEKKQYSLQRFASQVDVNNDLSKLVTTHYLPKERESAVVKPQHMIAPGSSRYSSNDMVHNHYLEEAKKKTQENGRNSEPSVMPSARSQSIANGSNPTPRINNQKSRNWPASKSSCVTKKTVPIAEHSRNSRSFPDSKHFVCSTCRNVSLMPIMILV
ncbi:hypothetical protein Tco_0894158 [Tanacetum coccineum]|uniref:Uncharacterized protein n=1 Tax=Tanacetum coccineum TaxID=301880 RepID=A0ABQ5CAY8_9ASTR